MTRISVIRWNGEVAILSGDMRGDLKEGTKCTMTRQALHIILIRMQESISTQKMQEK